MRKSELFLIHLSIQLIGTVAFTLHLQFCSLFPYSSLCTHSFYLPLIAFSGFIQTPVERRAILELDAMLRALVSCGFIWQSNRTSFAGFSLRF